MATGRGGEEARAVFARDEGQLLRRPSSGDRSDERPVGDSGARGEAEQCRQGVEGAGHEGALAPARPRQVDERKPRPRIFDDRPKGVEVVEHRVPQPLRPPGVVGREQEVGRVRRRLGDRHPDRDASLDRAPIQGEHRLPVGDGDGPLPHRGVIPPDGLQGEARQPERRHPSRSHRPPPPSASRRAAKGADAGSGR